MTDRRNFIKNSLGISALFVAESVASPLQNFIDPPKTQEKGLRKISGRVTSGTKPLKGVAVSDGVSVVTTSTDGYFELSAGKDEKFLFISNPAGYAVNTNPTGTARFYEKITDKAEQVINFDLKTTGNDTRHSFFLLADPQPLDMEDIGLFNAETIPDLIEMAKGRTSLFGVACGDIVFNDLKLFPEYEKAIKKTGIPFFQVLGNHDTDHGAGTDELSVATFNEFFGPRYYSFNKGKIHYIVLDDIFWFGDYIGYLDQKQLDWMEQDLALVPKGKTVVVFCHIPPYNTEHIRYKYAKPNNSVVITNRKMLYNLLKPYKSFVLTGHMHESEYIEEEGIEIHVCGAVCGAWWTAPTCFDGTPKGYGIYEVDGTEIRWKYKSTGKPIGHQMSLHKITGKDGKPLEVMANVWSWDKYCRVNWYQDGTTMGEMEKRRGSDPETVLLFEGDKKPKKHTWVEPATTDHLFYAKPSPGAKVVEVEYANRWGEKFRDKITL